MMMERS
jgi:hypothetical protein